MISSSLQERIDLLAGGWKREKRLRGLKGGARAFFLSLLGAKARRPLLVITPTVREAESLFCDLNFFLQEEQNRSPLKKRLHLFPSWEILPFERLSPHPDQVAARLEGLYYLTEGEAPIIVSTPSALMQKVIPQDLFRGSYRRLARGEELERDSLLEQLVAWGFQHVPLVEERGDFSVRGAIVDIFPPAYPRPIRLEFFGDRIDSIREFDPATQRSEASAEEFLLLPMKEFSLKQADISTVAKKIEKRAEELEIGRKEKNAVLESLRDGIPFPGIEFLLPYFYPELSSVFTYLPSETLIWIEEPARADEEAERFVELVWDRAAKAKEEERLAPPIETLYLSEAEWREGLSSFSRIHSESLDVLPPAAKSDSDLSIRCHLNANLHSELTAGKEPSLAPLVGHLKEWQAERVFLVASTLADAHRLKELLARYEIYFPILHTPFLELILGDGVPRGIGVGSLTQGFRLPEERLIVITADEIFGTKRSLTLPKKKKYPSRFITSLSELKQDDYIVHIDHGIGIYRGLRFLRVENVEGEFLHLEYEGGDRLYLPVDRINLIQKYIGGDGAKPQLDRLGGTSWEKVKARTRRSILAMARELVELYAAREVVEGHAFPAPDPLYREFEASFEYEATQDQEKAIEDVLQDLQRKKPSDRLICGDVGYGKTEVAMRAAFIAVMDGKQVAVLVPTTILAEQHLHTFRHRFRNYPVRIEMLSRFLSPKEVRQVLQDLAKGAIDIVVGTHRLLQSDVRFRDLGLLVVDEEHRFGVVHKERLKKLRTQVDVISLTATPIPRTLHMSLVGIRDMSIIETAPPGRQAIRTTITRYDEGIIRDAILRELNRGGQVFFLHNRVETISIMAQKLKELVPEARIAVAHGQMRARELEKVMRDFLENRTQVLVCSAIIESGLDFPNANTIIINRADKFGLADLYQLRGRVGRSPRRAYAYLLIPGEKLITRDAEKRLQALQELDELGGGFKLALHDLEIRGAGNLLGKEQSGHIAAVGFELYTQMMEKAVRELRGEPARPEVEPEIRIGVPAYFPHDYIPDANQRLLFYKRLASLVDLKELETIKEELQDRYGPFAEEVENLFRIMHLRHVLKDYLVEQISYRDGRVSLLFHPGSRIRVEKLVELASKDRAFRLAPEGRLSFTPKRRGWEEMIPEVIELLKVIEDSEPGATV